jgi:hypothetical protein
MSSDHEAEIQASVAAHADLGPGYDDAVAEGLVERIGAEIDKRIDARLGQFGAVPGAGRPARSPGYQPPGYQSPGYPGAAAPASAQPGVPAPAGAAGAGDAVGPAGQAGPAGPAGPVPGGYQAPVGYQAPAGYHGYQGYQGYMGPMLPPGYQLGPPARPSQVSARNVATTITALGSMALGVAATAVVSRGDHGGVALMVLLIWVAIAVINVAYARRP